MVSRTRTLKHHAPRIIAAIFTAASAAWTLYSVWDLLGVGPVAITAGTGAEGLWVGGMLAYRAQRTKLTCVAMLAGLAGTLAILAVHGFGTYGWGGIVAVVPPLAAELFWHVDAQLTADPTALTTEQQDEVNDVLRQARHITARAAADQAREDAEHAAKLARIRRDGELRQAEDLADFDVAVSRIDMQRQITRRAPLMLPAPLAPEDTDGDGPDKPGKQRPPVSADIRTAIAAALATMPGASPEDIADALTTAGFDTDPDTVRAVSGQQDTSSARILPIGGTNTDKSIADTVRRAVRAGLDKPDAVLAAVRRVHGHDVNPDTVERTRRRVAG
jgi:hypothetical protein